MTRKEFLKKSSKGLLALGLLGSIPYCTNAKETHTKNTSGLRVLGNTGMQVSAIGFGASRTMEPTLVKYAIDGGVTFLDTGRVYYNGQNEVMVGNVIKGIRKRFIVQSRFHVPLRDKNKKNTSPQVSQRIKNKMQSSLQESLKALQTDYLDILLIHGASSPDVIHHAAVMEFFSSAKKKGMIRACGFSSHANQIQLLKAANESRFYDVIMVPYNHKGSYKHSLSGQYFEWDQPALEKELQKAANNNMAIVAMKTCSGGPYAPDTKSKPSYKAALQWILNHSYIHSMAVAMGNIEEVDENIQVMF
jgi:aryl-alcohol dehydrogenase-like predicted oxidoreductase